MAGQPTFVCRLSLFYLSSVGSINLRVLWRSSPLGQCAATRLAEARGRTAHNKKTTPSVAFGTRPGEMPCHGQLSSAAVCAIQLMLQTFAGLQIRKMAIGRDSKARPRGG